MTGERDHNERLRGRARDALVAWAGSIVLALHFWWTAGYGFVHLPRLERLRDDLGAQPLPQPVRLFSQHPWTFAVLFVFLGASILVKEVAMRDKRRSLLITCLVAIVLLVVVDVSRVLIMDPLYHLIGGAP